MHFYGARFVQTLLLNENPKVIIRRENSVFDAVHGTRSCLYGWPSIAVQEVDGNVVSGSVPGVSKMVSNMGTHVDSVLVRVFFGFQSVEGSAWNLVFHQGERCLWLVSPGYPDVDDHADKGYERGHPCCRCPGEAPNPIHNSIFPHKKNAAVAAAA